jgi:hypothetical protein
MLLPVAAARAMPTALAARSSTPPPCYGDRFDAALGLWSHPDLSHQSASARLATLPRAHSLPRNAARLVVAAQLGRLHEEPLDAVLAGLRRLQCTDGSASHGNFAWWAEEGRVTDTNAAFFVGLNLCVLRIRYADSLTAGQREFIDAMCLDLHRWFSHAVAERSFHYPNKYLGDLVCAWLLCEILGRPPSPDLVEAIIDATTYWLTEGWGWGEHLSDIYTGVMFSQLGALLLLSRTLPKPVREHFVRLFSDLVRLERAFAGGPRVPAIRSYAFTAPTRPRPYLDRVQAWIDWTDTVRNETDSVVHFAYYHLFHEEKLLKLAPPSDESPALRELSVACLRGAFATASITPTHRIGSVSHFPLMPEAEFLHWGLSWQSFPVAFTAGAQGWGFLRWRSREDGVEVGHPSIRRDLHKALSRATIPAITGFTESRQRGARVVALRRMPRVSTRWEQLADALELIGFDLHSLRARPLPDGGRLLLARHEGRDWTFGHHPLVSGTVPEIVSNEHGPAWQVTWPARTLSSGVPRIAHLWWMAPGEHAAPTLVRLPQKGPYLLSEEQDSLWRLTWPEAGAEAGEWIVDFDLRLPLGEAILDA